MTSFKEHYGPWCVIAGGSDGIGAAFAHEVAARGINLILIARKAGNLDELSAQLRIAHPDVEVRTLSQDLGREDAIGRIKEVAADVEVGCLIYNVGAEPNYGDFLDHDWDMLRGRLQRNFLVKAALVHHFGRQMRARKRGGMILMGSVSGFSGSPGFALYASSKAFTHNLSEGLWYEFKKDNVHLLCPIVGATNTPTMINAYGPIEGHATDPAFIAKGALERIGKGPIWVADDIVKGVTALSAMAPADRATLTAQRAADFAKKK
ncbi:MAG: SDR family NAD(P)-dependent oxidoreductase [Georgfuchsia sp.]